MAKPKTIHTVASLKARATEEGECLLWNGYTTNGVPMVHRNGAMVAVRKLLLQLTGVPLTGAYFPPRCDNPLCIEPDHIVQRSEKIHMRKMDKQAHTTHRAAHKAGVLAWRQSNPIKLDKAKAQAIREDERSRDEVAAQYGISVSLVSKIKAGTQWLDTSNPFAGLMQRSQ